MRFMAAGHASQQFAILSLDRRSEKEEGKSKSSQSPSSNLAAASSTAEGGAYMMMRARMRFYET